MHDGMPYGRIQGQGQGHSREVDRQSPMGLIFFIAVVVVPVVFRFVVVVVVFFIACVAAVVVFLIIAIIAVVGWRRSIVVRTLVSAGELSLSCARLLAGWVTTLRLSHLLSVSQHRQLSHPSLRGRYE